MTMRTAIFKILRYNKYFCYNFFQMLKIKLYFFKSLGQIYLLKNKDEIII